MNNDYKKAQFKKMAAEAELNLSGDCPLIEDEALVWADKKIIELEDALKQSINAMGLPGNATFKKSAELVALDMANEALK